MEDNKILYTVYYDPKLAHEFTGPSPPGVTLPPLNFRHAPLNPRRSANNGGVSQNTTHAHLQGDSSLLPVAAPVKTRTKRKLSYSDNLVTFPVEAPAGHKKGRLSGNYTAQNGPPPWGLHSGGSSSSDLQEGHSMGSISSYTSLSSSFLPSPGPLQTMHFAGQSQPKMEPPIDPVLTNSPPATGSARTGAALAALAVLDKAGISPLEMLLMILDPTLVELEKERSEFFAQENHAKIHALLTNLQSNARLKQDFNVVGRAASTAAPACRQVGDGGGAAPSA